METQRFSTLSWELSAWGQSLLKFDESASAFDIYELVINLDVLIELLVQQSNPYSQQVWRNFLINAEEIKSFIDVNYILAATQCTNG